LSRQLTFDLGAQAGFGRADFFPSHANALALAAVNGWSDWSQRKLLLIGPAGSGKTHLAHLWAAEAEAKLVSGRAVAGMIDDCPPGGSLAVDDADAVAGQAEAETALFHLHNRVVDHGGRLLLTARLPLRDWGLTLPDLASRIAAADVARLEAPDDALLSAVLVKLFADRQIAVPPTLIPYLVTRMERSVAAAADLVARLDAAALANKGAVTRALAAELLDRAEGA
jgi:chromosomal replication initiation ATPase DnaA